ncbi:MAG: SpoVA/SpoVAEb family sporulation membrane protein [Clostridia bacterium]|nr:SpoVA/SpoVAEb family sporulation membrane protein [Clostridia bacterium]
MEVFERDKKYNEYLNSKIPKTKPWPSLFHAFWIGGLICLFGEVIKDLLMLIPNMSVENASVWESIILIAIASILTGFGVYDKLGAYAGAGTIVPITGFSNSITSPALEFKREGFIFGLCAKMFIISGPVIVCGVIASIVAGLIYLIF